MRYTIRPTFLAHKVNEDGFGTIRIALTIDRDITYHATTYRIHKKQWDQKKRIVVDHPNAAIINIDLRRQIAKIEKQIVESKLQDLPVTSKIISGEDIKQRSFYAFAKEVRNDQKELNRVKAFAGGSLLLSEIDVTFLRKFQKHEEARGMANNTINTSFKYIRRIINQARAEKLLKENPFDDFEMVKYKQSDRTYLTEKELQKLLSRADDLTSSMRTTAYYFLLGAFSGLRHSDWGRFNYDTMVEGGFLKIRAKKNKRHVVLPIGKSLKKVIEVVKDFPPPLTNQKCNVMLKAIGSVVGIRKELTTHVARHSFGCLCAANRIPKSVTAELMGITTATVEVYYHLTGENIKEQAAALLKI